MTNERLARSIKKSTTDKPSSAPLCAVISKITKTQVILSCEALGELRWPLANFTETPKVGKPVYLSISSSDQNEHLTALRKLLEELIS
ncbi:MAG: hypothetical protein UT55_C0022G0004 [Candidatus Peregrinibacteria bacterium GW2011_GWE2_39_6]|nr:MAG: hypothetical protein UT36_C0006G0021 [Candidatus Peregrinibacteria bacterium GW2011_GWF2_39_17]KKR25986.1 MAG: hypothetical protein UT55_C0022G0004 [Candidatus Peregrinibacteria bacterium GW2011_GWE2_39_6]HCW32816.1 hypothetical protein [Candidatus Peregrinibacteria bacterium]